MWLSRIAGNTAASEPLNLVSAPATFGLGIGAPVTVDFAIPAGAASATSATWVFNNALWALNNLGGGNGVFTTTGASHQEDAFNHFNGTHRFTDSAAVTGAQLADIQAAAGTNLAVLTALGPGPGTDTVTIDAFASFWLTLHFSGAGAVSIVACAENGDLQGVWPGVVSANELVFLKVTYTGYVPGAQSAPLPKSWTWAEARAWGGWGAILGPTGVLRIYDATATEFLAGDPVAGCDLWILGK